MKNVRSAYVLSKTLLKEFYLVLGIYYRLLRLQIYCACNGEKYHIESIWLFSWVLKSPTMKLIDRYSLLVTGEVSFLRYLNFDCNSLLQESQQLGHFRVSPGLCIKTSLSARAVWCGNDFNSPANKTHSHKKGCALSLILKETVFGTPKWPISIFTT